MRRNLTWLKWSACVTLAAVVACAHAAPAGNVDEEARALAPKVRDYMTKQRLIRIGLPSVGPLFEQLAATKDANMAFECRSTLRWIAEWADSDKAKADLRAAFSEYTKPEQPGPVRETAAMLLGVVGGEESVPLLKPLLNDAAARESACTALEGIPGRAATQALTDAYKTAPTPFRRTLLAALANRRDPAGLPTLIKATEDKDDEVVVAALEALGVAGERDGLSALEKAIKKGSEVRRRAAFPAYVRVGEALVKQGRMKDAASVYGKALGWSANDAECVAVLRAFGCASDPAAIPQLQKAMASDSADVKAAALTAYLDVADGLLEKGGKEAAGEMYPLALERATGETEQMRALAGCGRTADPALIGRMTPLFQSANPRVQAAAAAAIHRIPGKPATQALASALDKASPALRSVILPALAARRDAEAVPAIAAVAAGPDEAVWLAAVEALGAIADPSAAPAMLKAAETGPEAVKLAAAQGYVRVADGMAEKQPSEASAMYHRVLGWQGDEARAAALVGLRRMASPEALPKIEPLLDKEKGKVRDEAINVCIAIGAKQLEAGKRDEAKRIFQKTLGLLPGMDLRAADLKKRLRALGEKMVFEAKDGVISAWWLLGSFKVEQKDWEKALEPEKEKEIDLAKEYTFDGKKRRWDPVQTSDAKGIVQLDPLFTPNDNCGCYAYAEIVVGEEQDVRLKLGSDDGIICWVNGKQVHAFLKPRSLKVDEDDVEAHFAAGVNKVLLKILEGGGQWNFCVRLTDAKGQPLKFRMQ